MWKIIVLCTSIVVSLTVAAKSTYENYKVFKIVPLTSMEFRLLKQIVESNNGLFFWEEPTILKKPAKLMVAPHMLPEFYRIMNLYGSHHELFINNVQELIDQTTQSIHVENITHNPNIFPFTKYPTLYEIDDYIANLSLTYKNKVKKIMIGESSEGNQISGVKISFNNNSENPGIFLEGGIHANEWISPVTVIYILHQLITSTDPDVRALAESHDWYIFPLLNPDGYKYTHTTDRLWKKSRKQYGPLCMGVDLDKNWNYKSRNYKLQDLHIINQQFYVNWCSNKYAGPVPFSEPETRALKKYLDHISNKFYAYISFHGSSQLLMFPYGHTTAHVENYVELYTIGLNATAALKQKYRTEYHVGSVAETIHLLAYGTTIDYVKDVHRKNFVYCYHLRDRIHDFLLPPDQIIPTGQETLDSLVSMFKQIRSKKIKI